MFDFEITAVISEDYRSACRGGDPAIRPEKRLDHYIHCDAIENKVSIMIAQQLGN